MTYKGKNITKMIDKQFEIYVRTFCLKEGFNFPDIPESHWPEVDKLKERAIGDIECAIDQIETAQRKGDI